MMQYFSDAINDVAQAAWRTGNLEVAREAEGFQREFTTRGNIH
jgi:hypothetical protein